jgi:hypothetical protein
MGGVGKTYQEQVELPLEHLCPCPPIWASISVHHVQHLPSVNYFALCITSEMCYKLSSYTH